MVVWWGTRIEIRSALARLVRERQLQPATRIAALESLFAFSQSWREIHPIAAVRDKAIELLDLYPLRAADSLNWPPP
jgi:hypothetical protein